MPPDSQKAELSPLEFLNTIVDLKAAICYSIGFAASAALFAAQTGWGTRLGLASPEHFFIIAATAFLGIGLGIGKSGLSLLESRYRARRAVKALKSLAPAERQLLEWCVLHDRQTVYSLKDHPVVHGLRGKAVLETSAEPTQHAQAHTIPDHVWDVVNRELREDASSGEMRSHLLKIGIRELLIETAMDAGAKELAEQLPRRTPARTVSALPTSVATNGDEN